MIKMKFLSALFGVAAITSYVMAAPAEDMKDVKEAKEGTEAVDKAQVDNWDWCAPDFTVRPFFIPEFTPITGLTYPVR